MSRENGELPTRFLIFPKRKKKMRDTLKIFSGKHPDGVLLSPGELKKKRQ